MTIARKGLRAPQAPAHTRTRSAIVVLITILASGGCAKQDSAPPPASADAAATQSSATAPTAQPVASPPNTIPEPFHGMWASTVDGCQAIQTGAEPAVTITASEIRDVEYETFCTLHSVVSASATELVAEFVCPSADDQKPAPAQRSLALAAGRLVFQDRPVSYLRCAGEAPPPPVELAEPIEAPPATAAQDVELKVPDYMTTENFVNFTWNSLFCSGIITEGLRREAVSPEGQEALRTVAQGYRDSAEELAKRAGLSESEFAAQRDLEIPAEVRKVYELAGTSSDVRRGLTEQLDTCVKQSKTMVMLAMAIISEDAKARESDPSKPAPAAPFGRTTATSSPVTTNESTPTGTAGSPSIYRRCLTDPAGPKAFTEARLNRMESLARAIDQYASGQYDTYLRMRESYSYMERNPNGTPDSICSFADLIPVEAMEQTLRQLSR